MKYSDTFTSAASTVRLVSFDMRRGSIFDLLPDFNRGGLWKHGGSKRANTATRTFEKQSAGCGASSQISYLKHEEKRTSAQSREIGWRPLILKVTGSNPVPATKLLKAMCFLWLHRKRRAVNGIIYGG
jgi:hypothetical protein